jgi:hypothetical protein
MSELQERWKGSPSLETDLEESARVAIRVQCFRPRRMPTKSIMMEKIQARSRSFGLGSPFRVNSTERGVRRMTTKELVIEMIQRMPQDATLTDIMAELYVRQKVDVGLRELDEGKTLSQEEVEQRLSRWLS